MSSLNAHLREAGDHGRLPFHRDCPVCRAERLAGTLPDRALVSPRLSATLVATALAASASPPTMTALAGAPPAIRHADAPRPPAGGRGGDERPVTADGEGHDGRERDGGTAPPERDDGHGKRDGAAPPAPAAPADGKASPEPDTGEPALDAAPSRPADPPHPPTSKPEEPGPPHPPAEQSTPPSRPDAPAPGTPEPPRKRDERSSATPSDPSRATTARGRSERERRAVDPERTPRRRSAVHVVERGECLWTIAEERLGRDASDAAIARAVVRMWELNDRRIRSGDPDLIFPGERLRMPGG